MQAIVKLILVATMVYSLYVKLIHVATVLYIYIVYM